MTGGGSALGSRVTHGFTLHCDPREEPNNLRVNWEGNRFNLERLDSAACSDDPAIEPNPPGADFDTYAGAGTGIYNGVSGATARWKFTDAGQPGRNDRAEIIIKDASGDIVLSVSGILETGNHQANGRAVMPLATSGSSSISSAGAGLLLGVSAGAGGLASAAWYARRRRGVRGRIASYIGQSRATAGATRSLGSRQVADQLPVGQLLLVHVQSIGGFPALVDALRALSRMPGIAQAHAVRLNQGDGIFDVMLSASATREELERAASAALGCPVQFVRPR